MFCHRGPLQHCRIILGCFVIMVIVVRACGLASFVCEGWAVHFWKVALGVVCRCFCDSQIWRWSVCGPRDRSVVALVASETMIQQLFGEGEALEPGRQSRGRGKAQLVFFIAYWASLVCVCVCVCRCLWHVPKVFSFLLAFVY